MEYANFGGRKMKKTEKSGRWTKGGRWHRPEMDEKDGRAEERGRQSRGREDGRAGERGRQSRVQIKFGRNRHTKQRKRDGSGRETEAEERRKR